MERLKKMKSSKKFAALALSLVIIMVCAVSPTFSWLSAKTDPVVNYFAGGAIAIKIDEAKVGPDGKELEGEERTDENHYKYTAGAVLDKDPTPTVYKESDACYVFAFVENELGDKFSMNTKTDSWKKVAEEDGSTLYIYKEIVDASESEENITLDPVFTKVTVSDDLTQQDIQNLGENKTIKITSYAVQSEGVDSKSAIDIAVAEFLKGVTPTYVTVE